MIETTLYKMGEEWGPVCIDYALKQHGQWYLGDGAYGDGPEFHWDYYNSFVIHPMLVDIIENMGDQYRDWDQVWDWRRVHFNREFIFMFSGILTIGLIKC